VPVEFRVIALMGTRVADDIVAVVMVTVAGAPANNWSAEESVEATVTE